MQGIVIQGPTNLCKEVVSSYKDIPNVVWSTWDDEPQENITFISQFMPVVLNKKPDFGGYLNINLQTLSTTGGINYLKNQGVTEILKVRGDIVITNLNELLSILKGKDMAFLAICKLGARKIYYELVYPHLSHDYPVDLVLYGSTENLIDAFSFLIEEYLPIPPESLISYNYLINKNIKFELSYDNFISNNIYFFLKDCVENNIQLNWLKYNCDLVQTHNNDNYEF